MYIKFLLKVNLFFNKVWIICINLIWFNRSNWIRIYVEFIEDIDKEKEEVIYYFRGKFFNG